jgi:hypothetical protein
MIFFFTHVTKLATIDLANAASPVKKIQHILELNRKRNFTDKEKE